MRAITIELHKEIRIYAETTYLIGIEFDHPTAHSIRIELLIPGVVEGVSEVNAPPIAAHLDHLWRTVQWHIWFLRVRRAAHDASQMHRTGEPGVERIGNIVASHLSRAPAGDVEKAVVEREIDVADQRRYRFEALQQRRQLLGFCWLRRDLDYFLDVPTPLVSKPQPD